MPENFMSLKAYVPWVLPKTSTPYDAGRALGQLEPVAYMIKASRELLIADPGHGSLLVYQLINALEERLAEAKKALEGH
jgi:hypothetical protein